MEDWFKKGIAPFTYSETEKRKASRQHRWVPVAESLPEGGKTVAAMDDSKRYYIAYVRDGKLVADHMICFQPTLTYWAALPELAAPSEESA